MISYFRESTSPGESFECAALTGSVYQRLALTSSPVVGERAAHTHRQRTTLLAKRAVLASDYGTATKPFVHHAPARQSSTFRAHREQLVQVPADRCAPATAILRGQQRRMLRRCTRSRAVEQTSTAPPRIANGTNDPDTTRSPFARALHDDGGRSETARCDHPAECRPTVGRAVQCSRRRSAGVTAVADWAFCSGTRQRCLRWFEWP